MLSPPTAAAPLEKGAPPAEPTQSDLQPDGVLPLEGEATRSAEPHPILSKEGTEPLAEWSRPAQARKGPAPVIVRPLRDTPIAPVRPPDPRTTRVVRFDVMTGPLFRVRQLDPTLSTSVEMGAMHGFSGAFYTGMIVATKDDGGFPKGLVREFDFPIGFGAVARGKLRKRPLYGSIGLTAGLLVQRAKAEGRLIHHVDPDFRLPIRFAWTIATVGFSLALEQGYSVRSRSYMRRGAEVWARSAYRIGIVLGLHFDIIAGRTALSQSRRRVRSRS